MDFINSPSELLCKMKTTAIKNILIGNGFSLSHPTLRNCFIWDMHQALCSHWSQIIPKKSNDCPEKDLNAIRVNITKRILYYYINRITENIAHEVESLKQIYQNYKSYVRYNCSKFLSAPTLEGGSIFTLNYDPLLYFEILKLLEDSKCKHFDGFIINGDSGRDGCISNFPNPNNHFLNQQYIKCKIEKDTRSNIIKVFYVHGSWFIQANNEDELAKLDFSSGSADVTVDSLFENGRRPFLILEDRWRTKRAILEGDPYLKFCYDHLSQIQGSLLIFGCSFSNDEHILKAISENGKLQKIYITYLTQRDLDRLKKDNLAKYPDVFQKTEYIQIGDNCIWESNT